MIFLKIIGIHKPRSFLVLLDETLKVWSCLCFFQFKYIGDSCWKPSNKDSFFKVIIIFIYLVSWWISKEIQKGHGSATQNLILIHNIDFQFLQVFLFSKLLLYWERERERETLTLKGRTLELEEDWQVYWVSFYLFGLVAFYKDSWEKRLAFCNGWNLQSCFNTNTPQVNIFL